MPPRPSRSRRPGRGISGIPGGENDLLANQGIIRAVQKNGTAIVVSRASNYGIFSVRETDEQEEVNCLQQLIIIFCHFSAPEAVYLGEQMIGDDSASSINQQPVFLDLGQAYAAFNPLILTDCGREVAVKIAQVNNYLTISLINYEGPKKTFSVGELKEVFNGFTVDLSGPNQHASFDDFRQSWQSGKIEDLWLSGCRRTRLKRDDLDLMINWITAGNRLKNVMIDGREHSREPIQCEFRGLKQLPFAHKPYHSMNYQVPTDSLDIAWYPELKWQQSKQK